MDARCSKMPKSKARFSFRLFSCQRLPAKARFVASFRIPGKSHNLFWGCRNSESCKNHSTSPKNTPQGLDFCDSYLKRKEDGNILKFAKAPLLKELGNIYSFTKKDTKTKGHAGKIMALQESARQTLFLHVICVCSGGFQTSPFLLKHPVPGTNLRLARYANVSVHG